MTGRLTKEELIAKAKEGKTIYGDPDFRSFEDLNGEHASRYLASRGFVIEHFWDCGFNGWALTTCGVKLSTNGYICMDVQKVSKQHEAELKSLADSYAFLADSHALIHQITPLPAVNGFKLNEQQAAALHLLADAYAALSDAWTDELGEAMKDLGLLPMSDLTEAVSEIGSLVENHG